jgi:hypothetical protein
MPRRHDRALNRSTNDELNVARRDEESRCVFLRVVIAPNTIVISSRQLLSSIALPSRNDS